MTDNVLRVNEVYTARTVQGEGPHVGRVCTFVRLYGCNLHCRWCDTPYTWDVLGRNGTPFPTALNSTRWTVEDVADAVYTTGAALCVVSGGEPLLQSTALLNLARELSRRGIEVHVETNGTLLPPRHDDDVAHYSVSPKLPSADAGPRALDVPKLRAWAQHPRAIFKVVCSTPGEVDAAAELFTAVGARPEQRWVMPEGITAASVEASLSAIIDRALHHSINVSPRLHVAVWGTERGR